MSEQEFAGAPHSKALMLSEHASCQPVGHAALANQRVGVPLLGFSLPASSVAKAPPGCAAEERSSGCRTSSIRKG